jgi:hypothetical protein
MKQSLLLFSLCFGLATQAQNNFQYLDINNVKAGVSGNGILHRDPSTQGPSCEVPKFSGKHSDDFATLWFGGMYNNQLYLATPLTSPQTADFNSGPLTIVGPNIVTDSAKYTKVWKLNKSDINDFIANYAAGNVQNGTYVPAPDLLSWPGNGDIQKTQDFILAPFMDLNGDMVYDPLGAGEYPLIKGDQALFFIYNDVSAAPHASGGQTFGLEIRCMAYAYGTCSVVTSNPVLDNTTFYDYTIVNRSTRTYTDFYIGLHSEANLGLSYDDYIGCDVKDNYGYVYNGDADDETITGVTGYGTNPPAAAFVMLRSPEAMADGIDNDGDGMTDEAGEQMGMTNFSYFATAGMGIPPGMDAPSIATEYYNYMGSMWKDGTSLTCNSTYGYGGSTATPYAYPGITYTNSVCGNASWTESAAPGDRRYIMSTKAYSFQPGEVIRYEVAHVTSFPASGSALSQLDQDVASLKTFYQSGAGNSCLATGIETQPGITGFELYPNPAASEINLSFGNALTATIEVSDVYGKIVLSTKTGGQEKVKINTVELASGIYFVKVSAEGKSTTVKFVKVSNH